MLSSDVPVKPVIAAAAAFLVVRSLLRSRLAARPEGKAVYWAVRGDVQPLDRIAHALLGFAPMLAAMESGTVHDAFIKIARTKLGTDSACSVVRFGQQLRVIVGDPKDVEYILLGSKARTLVKPALMKFLHPLLGPNGLVTITDEDFHTQQFRSVANAFSPLSVKNISATTMREHFMAATQLLKQRIHGNGDGPTAVGITQYLQEVTLRIISEAAFRTADLGKLQDILTAAMGNPSPLMIIGADVYNRLPTKRNTSCKEARSSIAEVVERVIAEAKAHPPAEKDKKLIDFMAEAPDLTASAILDHACTFAFAGHETTATALTWFTYYMTRHPEAQAKLAEELADAFPADVAPRADALKELEYLNAAIHEVLRIRPPVSVIGRCATEDLILPGSETFVPAGSDLIISVYANHRDPAVWGPDAETFRPERWTEDAGLKQRVQPCSFMPFAVGKRGCIGKDFAMQELLLGAAMLVRNFVFEWPEGQPEPKRTGGFMARPKKPFDLRIRVRTE